MTRRSNWRETGRFYIQPIITEPLLGAYRDQLAAAEALARQVADTHRVPVTVWLEGKYATSDGKPTSCRLVSTFEPKPLPDAQHGERPAA